MFSEDLEDYTDSLGLPKTFVKRNPIESASVDEVYASLSAKGNKRRKYLLGLYPSFVILAEDLCTQNGVESIDRVYDQFPPVEMVATGTANTLILGSPNLSLRIAYNRVEKVIRHDLQRPDFPNCAPHATQAWSQYREVFELICTMTPAERFALMRLLWGRIISIPCIEAQDGMEREIRPFEHIVLNFPTAKREPAGVVLQALAYAYYRADSPSVTFRPYKVGSGSSRVGAAGDVDGWDGNVLSLSVEVKDKAIDETNLNEIDQFIKQLERWPNATGIVLANSFSPLAVDYLEKHNILAFDRQRMAVNVSYWDVPKQKLAVKELHYYFGVIQRHSRLTKRFESFCESAGIKLR